MRRTRWAMFAASLPCTLLVIRVVGCKLGSAQGVVARSLLGMPLIGTSVLCFVPKQSDPSPKRASLRGSSEPCSVRSSS